MSTEVSYLIQLISKSSAHNGESLLDFMDKYRLSGLKNATKVQLKEYALAEGLIDTENYPFKEPTE